MDFLSLSLPPTLLVTRLNPPRWIRSLSFPFHFSVPSSRKLPGVLRTTRQRAARATLRGIASFPHSADLYPTKIAARLAGREGALNGKGDAMFGSTADLHKQRHIPRLRVPSCRDYRGSTSDGP